MPEQPQSKSREVPPPRVTREHAALPYAELDVVTNFSFLRGASHPDELVYRAAELGYRAIAVTDVNTLAGVVRAHVAAKEARIKLIVGARLQLQDGPDLLVWAPDRAAYGRLCRLLTLGKRRAKKGECVLRLADVAEMGKGLWVGIDGQDAGFRDGDGKTAGISASSLSVLREAFGGRLSITLTLLYGNDDVSRVNRLTEISRRLDVPLVAVNHVHYHEAQRRPLQDVLTCVRHGCTIADAGYRLLPNAERYLKSPEQMHRLMASCPGAIARAMEIAEGCSFSLDELKYEYPHELTPSGKSTIEHLSELAWSGAAGRYPEGIPERVRQQILHELELIEQLKYEAYFLTVYDLVMFARGRGILCQGRGSAANSAVCYCLGVTSVDPAKIDLLFERFVSAARNEPPDIDIDFEHARREEVLQYIYQKYGRDRAGMTAEIISYRGRSAVRDVGKALGLSLDMVDQMARKLDWWTRGVLTAEQLREAGLDPADRTVQLLVELTAQLLGFPRHLGQHVGGMVMTRGPLCELVPIENAAMEDRTVIEWDKDDIDALGILKVDCLALGMLTCISKAFALIEKQGGPALALHSIPQDDPAVYDMICEADTVGVFQIESRAQMSMLPRLRPRCFYDIVIEVAIVRPGPIQGDMVHPYLRRRSGEEPVAYPSEALRGVLEKTLGVPLFQEQAMKLAMVGAGFSAEEADQLRRAMAAWKKTGALERFHPKIIQGMLGNGYSPEFAEQCFNQIKGFGEYGFPESHSASFALLVYVSAWLKYHHPAAFCAALLNSQPMGFYAPAQIVRDARLHGVEVKGVDVNASDWECTLEDGPSVRLGFVMVRGLRQEHAERIVAARGEHGPFGSVASVQRLTGTPVATLRRLAEADAFGSLGLSRRQALWQVMELNNQEIPLFEEAGLAGKGEDAAAVDLPVMPMRQEVMIDYERTGLSLKKHPLALLRTKLAEMKIMPNAELQETGHGRWVRVAGLVLIRQRPGTAAGIVFETLEDETGIANLIIRPRVFERFRKAARHAALLCCDGQVQRQGKVIHVMAGRLTDLSYLLEGYEFASRDFH